MAEHGTRTKYTADKCRCAECTAANSRYIKEKRAMRRARLAVDPSTVAHGTVSAYRNSGCRCDECKGAARVYDLELARRNKAAAVGGDDDAPTAA